MLFVKTVGIFAKPNAPRAVRLVPELLAWLKAHDIEFRLDNETARYAGMLVGFVNVNANKAKCSLVTASRI